jgi:hypothetical protein
VKKFLGKIISSQGLNSIIKEGWGLMVIPFSTTSSRTTFPSWVLESLAGLRVLFILRGFSFSAKENKDKVKHNTKPNPIFLNEIAPFS